MLRDADAGPIFLLNAGAALRDSPAGAFWDLPDPAGFLATVQANTGDLLVADALVNHLPAGRVLGLSPDAAPDPSAWPHAAPSATVLRGSNYISPTADWSDWIPLLRALPGPIVAVGLGAQAPHTRRFEIPRGTQEALRIIADKSESVGVRGRFTAELLGGIGVRNTRVIGCPSLYRSCRPALSVQRPDSATARVGVTFTRGLWGAYCSNGTRAQRLQRELLREAVRRPGSRVYGQGDAAEALAELAPDPASREAAIEEVLRGHALAGDAAAAALLRSTLRTFWDPVPWFAHLREHVDAVAGFRLHGNVAALAQGIPAVFFTFDSRTRELAELFAMPSVEIEDYEPVRLTPLLQAADWSGFEAAYRRNYAAYVDFLEENGLPHRLPPAEPDPPAALTPVPPNGHAVRAAMPEAESLAWYREEALDLSKELYAAWQTGGWLRAELDRLRPAS
jgi:hypothetical protein